MATYSKHLLSGSTGGRQIKVAATATAGTTIHETGTSATTIDEVWIYATNQDTATITLTVEWGDTTDPDDRITIDIPAKSGLTPIVEGLPMVGTGAAARTIRAYAGTANKVLVSGFANRIT